MNRLSDIGAWVRGLWGWRRMLFAFAGGAVSALGFAPVEFFPALLLGFAALQVILDGTWASSRPAGAAFAAGWAFGFGQFLVGLHWIGYPFLVDPAAHLWQLPFAVSLLPAGLALFPAIAACLWQLVWRKGPARLLKFAIIYGVAEWLRGHIFTGFPWNLPAYGWGASLAVLQSLSLLGAYGLSFLTVLLGVALAELFGGKWRMPAIMVLLFCLIWAGGAARLAAPPTQMVPGVALRLVQPDIPQRELDNPAFFQRNWDRLIDLTISRGNPNLIVWPEAAPPPLTFDRSPSAVNEVRQITAPGRTLITGEVRSPDGLSAFNSLFIFSPTGPTQVYDKFHLVPFGEYVPFASVLNRIGITKLTEGQMGFASGDGLHTYKLTNAPPVTPLICYEIIFPGAVTPSQRPGWFVNVTDDSWFGPWAGPHQHLLIARARAIEEALPVARAANTGISAVIDPYGRTIAQLELGKMGVIDARLPRGSQPSPYALYGDWIFLLLLIASAAAALVATKVTQRQ